MQRSEYMDLAMHLGKSAGEVMRKNFTGNMKKEWKDERSPVTLTDLAINAMVLKERLCRGFLRRWVIEGHEGEVHSLLR